MNMRLINIGFGNLMSSSKIVAIISPLSAPAKRLKDEAKEEGRLIDATQGRRTRSIIITSSNQIFLSAVQAETLAGRFQEFVENKKTPSFLEDTSENT